METYELHMHILLFFNITDTSRILIDSANYYDMHISHICHVDILWDKVRLYVSHGTVTPFPRCTREIV